MRKFPVSLLCACATAAAPATASAEHSASTSASAYTLKTSRGSVARIGPFRPSQNPLLSAARRAFGTPSSVEGGDDVCVAEWGRLRLRIHFVNLGGHDACDPAYGRAQSFTVRGRRFKTWEGLRVGQSSDSILERHRAAEYREGSWWLRTAVSPFGDGGEYGVVRAIVRNGRVHALAGWIGAAGE